MPCFEVMKSWLGFCYMAVLKDCYTACFCWRQYIVLKNYKDLKIHKTFVRCITMCYDDYRKNVCILEIADFDTDVNISEREGIGNGIIHIVKLSIKYNCVKLQHFGIYDSVFKKTGEGPSLLPLLVHSTPCLFCQFLDIFQNLSKDLL